MKPEIKEAWISALRSGEYKQGKFSLRSKHDTFCCLGVLCDLHSKETGNEWVDNHSDYSYYKQLGGLPEEVLRWCGAKFDDLGRKGHPELTLSRWNDQGRPFTEIADLIEARV